MENQSPLSPTVEELLNNCVPILLPIENQPILPPTLLAHSLTSRESSVSEWTTDSKGRRCRRGSHSGVKKQLKRAKLFHLAIDKALAEMAPDQAIRSVTWPTYQQLNSKALYNELVRIISIYDSNVTRLLSQHLNKIIEANQPILLPISPAHSLTSRESSVSEGTTDSRRRCRRGSQSGVKKQLKRSKLFHLAIDKALAEMAPAQAIRSVTWPTYQQLNSKALYDELIRIISIYDSNVTMLLFQHLNKIIEDGRPKPKEPHHLNNPSTYSRTPQGPISPSSNL